jgi:hypothetical protein
MHHPQGHQSSLPSGESTPSLQETTQGGGCASMAIFRFTCSSLLSLFFKFIPLPQSFEPLLELSNLEGA